MLDVGSGSGILGIAALALGAGTVDAIDTDPEAVAATAANARVNGVADRLSVRQGTLDGAPSEPYPLVLANLVAAVLIELAPRLAAHLAPGGTLLASGIIDERAGRGGGGAGGRRPAVRRAPDRRRVGLAADAAGVTLHRFFVAPDAMRGDRFPLPESIAHQVTRVLRLQDGDRLVLLDGAGEAATVRLADGACEVESRGPAGGEPVHRLVVWQALLRGDHLEPVIRHGTEIGIAAFRLFVSERCVAREMSPRRLERLQAVAREAAEQSERGMVPPVAGAGAAARGAGADIGPAVRARRWCAARLADPAGRAWSSVRRVAFRPARWRPPSRRAMTVAGLGPRILRSESVALAAAAVVLSRSGDFA